jgi:class 3 adenylate cyclase/DNA-binding winged helix-turn-helix (wHTH) protein/tetratricopeptide (TPR) repeat protein
VPASLLRFGGFELDPASFQLRRSGRPLRLERIPLEVLLLLVERRGQLVLRQEIAERIWGRDVVLDIDNALNTAIRKVRQALRDDPAHARYVETVPAKGYRFIGAVTAAARPVVGSSAEIGPAHSGSPPIALSNASPDFDTSGHLVERIPAPRTTLEGERKQVTVLFAHLDGATGLLADRNPEDARKMLDPVLKSMMEAVHIYEGTVNQVMGDGIVALFGAPLAHEDHAVRACYAALRMQQMVKQDAEAVHPQGSVLIQVRVGLSSGEVVVRDIGSELQMHYTAVGQTIHLAAGMAQLAAPGSILATAGTLRLAAGYVQVRSLGAVTVKDLGEPVEAYEVTEKGEVRSRLQVAAACGFSRFVGRDAELAQLRRALAQARLSQGQVAAIVGEPGMGKSRLVLELIRSARAEGCLGLEARPVSYGRATSYLPVIGLLKDYFGIADRDTHRDVLDKVTEKILGLDPELVATRPTLLALLDVPFEDPQWQGLDPSQRRQRTLDAVTRLVVRETQRQPVLMVVEDLHWIDNETQAFLDRLVESLPTAPLLLLVDYRPEYRHTWGSRMYYTQLRLDPLSPESADELLDDLLGSDASLESFKTLLAERTERNPLFLEESVRTLVESQVLLGERGAYRLAQPVETFQVPATVQTTLASRIDRLPAEEKRLLESAAVIGKDVPFALLQVVAEESAESLYRRLGHLQTAELLYETRLFPDPGFTFKHALTHEVTYGSLLKDRRRALHARIVGAMETLYTNRLGEQVERLAHHSFRGELWEPAVRYLWQAGRKATDRSALREAVTRFEEALSALQHLPETRATLENACDIGLDLRQPLNLLGELPRVLAILREAGHIADKLADDHRRGRVSWLMVNAHNLRSELDQAVASGTRALEIADALGEIGLRIATTTSLEQTYFYRGEYGQTVSLARANLSLAEAAPVDRLLRVSAPTSVFDRHWLVRGLSQLGRFAEAMGPAETMLRLAGQMPSPLTQGLAHFAAATLHLWMGNWGTARVLHQRAIDLLLEGQQILQLSYVIGPLAWALACLDEPGEAVRRAQEAEDRLELIRTQGRKGGGAETYISLCHCYLMLGRLEDAQRIVERIPEDRTAASTAQALRLQAEIATHPDRRRPELAEDRYRRALALAEECGMRPLVADCHRGLGKLYQRTGKREQARECLTVATTMYREMDMQFWLAQAEAEVRELAGATG